jgi:hypothetical protein
MTEQEQRKALDEIYQDIPVYQPSEEEMDDQYRQYEAFLREEEMTSLDLDYDLE